MTPTALVNHGEQLEVDLIDPPGEMDYQRLAIRTSDDPGHKPMRQTPLDQVRWPGVQPVLVEIEVSRNGGSCRQEHTRERLRKTEFSVDSDGEQIYVSSGTPDKPERCQRRAADHDYLKVAGKGA